MENKDDLKLLKEAFEQFVKASESLKKSYDLLKEKYLSLENELKIVNKKLKKSLAEKKRLSSYLQSIIDSLNSGVVCFDGKGEITLMNRFALKFLKRVNFRNNIENIDIDEFLAFIEEAKNLKKFYEREIKLGNGKHFLLSFGEIKGKRGEYFFLFKDITELKALEEEAKRKTRLADMGEMAAEIAHEIRNPLGSIELYASMVEDDLKKAGFDTRYIRSIREEVKKLNSLLTNILLFTREIRVHKEKIMVEQFVHELKEIISPLLFANNIKFLIRTDVSEFLNDGELLKRAVLNLLINSVQAVQKKDNPKVELDIKREKDKIVIMVKDNGEGISEEVKNKVFNPFFTTKPKGSGLGLAVVYRIVSALGGRISFRSKKNSYTHFRIELPEES